MAARPSQHPTDALIRELIATRRAATRPEIAMILARMAHAPFDERITRVRVIEQGIQYLGHTLGVREDSLRYHLIKRVAIEAQWANGTTADSYLADLRRAIVAPTARLVVYERRGGPIAATITPTDDILEDDWLGKRSAPQLLTIYSADRGCLITGYQFSTLPNTGLPTEVLWLK